MLRNATVVVLVLAVSAATARAGLLDDAKRLVDIGDYPAAVHKLGELVAAEPTNAQARLLLATCFAKCVYDLQLPGPVPLGQNNQERARFEFGVLARLGNDGAEALVAAIGDPDERVALPAMITAGNFKLEATVGALTTELDPQRAAKKWLAAPGGPVYSSGNSSPPNTPNRVSAAVDALAQIGGDRPAAAILKCVATQPDGQRDYWLVSKFAACAPPPVAGVAVRKLIDAARAEVKPKLIGIYLNTLDPAGLIESAKSEKDMDVLSQMCLRSKMPQAAQEILARRTDLPDSDRIAAIKGMSWYPPVGDGRKKQPEDPKSLVSCLAELINDPSPAVSWAAVQDLAPLDPAKAIPVLMPRFTHAGQASTALYMLGETKNPAAIPTLLTMVEEMTDVSYRDTYKVDREIVFAALMKCGPQGDALYKAVKLAMTPVAGRLLNWWELVTGPEQESRSRTGRGSIPRDALPGIIDKLLAESDARFRREGMKLVFSLPTKDALVDINKALADKDAEVRRLAEDRLLYLVDDNQAKPSQVVFLLESEDRELRSRAGELLARKGDASMADAFLAALKDKKRVESVSSPAVEFFARFPDARAVGPLMDILLKDGSIGSGDKGLGNFAKAIKGGAADLPAAAKQVAKGLEVYWPRYRANAATVLQLLGDKSVLPQLREALAALDKAVPKTQADNESRQSFYNSVSAARSVITAAIRELDGEDKKP